MTLHVARYLMNYDRAILFNSICMRHSFFIEMAKYYSEKLDNGYIKLGRGNPTKGWIQTHKGSKPKTPKGPAQKEGQAQTPIGLKLRP